MELMDHWIVISEFVGVVVSTSDEKKAPPYMERLQKEHCIWSSDKLFRILDFFLKKIIVGPRRSKYSDIWHYGP